MKETGVGVQAPFRCIPGHLQIGGVQDGGRKKSRASPSSIFIRRRSGVGVAGSV